MDAIASTLTDETLLSQPHESQAAGLRLDPGCVIGTFEIQNLIGAGGMGAVYRARDRRLGRTVAIKLNKPSTQGTARRLLCSLLMREGQTMAKLSHPNLLAIFDVGIHAGCVYLAMEYVEGATLRVWAEGRNVSERFDSLLAAARGLEAAHAAGVIHRDFKPDNVLVGATGVRVCDFGLARSEAEIVDWGVSCDDCCEPEPIDKLAKSIDSKVVGTPRYMAPEQHDCACATELSDQYAFAVTAWELLCGGYPFAATTIGELRAAHRAGAFVAPPEHVSPALAEVLRHALRRDPATRFPSMTLLLDAMMEAKPA